MEVMKNFEKTGQNTLKNFLAYTEEEGDNNEWDIAVPPGEDAVSVMTIHKAKGLDRKVVIVLLVDTKPRADNLFFEKEEEGIQLLRITKVNAGISERLSGLYEKYRLERTVDDLNKLYVAFTRAKEEMYIISVKSKTSDDPSKYLPRTGYEPSKKPIVEIRERYTEKVAELYHSVVQVPLEETSLEKLALYERQRGEAIHAVLAKVINKGVEIENDLSSIIKEISGEWPEQINRDEIKRLVFEFLKLPEIEPFFVEKEGRAVLNEQEFVSSGGKLLRMDRVVADTGNVTVLDFKSGEDKKDYDIQLREYMEVLGDIYPGRIISGILAFVDRKKIRVVE
jgi:ATP-dependent exoDNAse (exonuclease V) beta subunit